jgi:methylase of polypeptide subunit release factors
MIEVETPLTGTSVSADPALRPSEYTAALIQVLRTRPDCVAGANVLEIGSGSGVVLAALGDLGAAALCGVDIEAGAVAAGEDLLRDTGHGHRAELYRGDMWHPVGGRRFDLVVANLPHFPMAPEAWAGRWPTWSAGGNDGRHLLDPFLHGLAGHLNPDGRAFITHNAFVGDDASRAALARVGLAMRVAATQLVYIPAEKLARMTPGVLRREDGRSIHRYGPYVFGEMHIVEIGAPATLA